MRKNTEANGVKELVKRRRRTDEMGEERIFGLCLTARRPREQNALILTHTHEKTIGHEDER